MICTSTICACNPITAKAVNVGLSPQKKVKSIALIGDIMSDKNKNIKIYIRVTEKEKEKISRIAEENNMSRSAYVLQCVRQNRIVNLNGVKDIVHQLLKIGANINQIATKANSINYISKDEVKKIQDIQINIFKMIDKFIIDNNKFIIEELQNNLNTDQKFELILSKIRNLEINANDIYNLLQLQSNNEEK